MATKLGRMVTYLDELLHLKSHDALIAWSCNITWHTKTIISLAPVLFLKEFGAPIVTYLIFYNLCVVTDGKISFSTLSSAELFLLNDLLLSTVELTVLPVLELFTL